MSCILKSSIKTIESKKKHCFNLYPTVYSAVDHRDDLRSADEVSLKQPVKLKNKKFLFFLS